MTVSALRQAFEAVGQPISGKTWDEVVANANGWTPVAIFGLADSVADLLGKPGGTTEAILVLDQETFERLQKASDKSTTYGIYAVARGDLEKWLKAKGEEVARALTLVGKLYW